MLAYGWTKAEIGDAVRYAESVYAANGGLEIIMFDSLEVISHACRLGGCSIHFTLRFLGSTKRLPEGGYPAGVAYRVRTVKVGVRDDIPWADLGITDGPEFHEGQWFRPEKRTRSTGSLCWHAFGHVFAYMFDVMPHGSIKTGSNRYDGIDGFRNNASFNRNHTECSCADLGLDNFFK